MLHPALSRALAIAHIEDLHRAAAERHPIRLGRRVAHAPHVAKPGKSLEPLAHTIACLDLQRPELNDSVDTGSTLVALMRQHGDELRRNHAVDALIAANPAAPAADVLQELDAHGLLDPADSEPGLDES